MNSANVRAGAAILVLCLNVLGGNRRYAHIPSMLHYGREERGKVASLAVDERGVVFVTLDRETDGDMHCWFYEEPCTTGRVETGMSRMLTQALIHDLRVVLYADPAWSMMMPNRRYAGYRLSAVELLRP